MSEQRFQVVLIGAGHGHLMALRQWQGRRLPFELTVVDPGKFSYSGMASGVVAGDYVPADAGLDPAQLVAGAGGRLLVQRALSIDRRQRRVNLESGSVSFDAISLNVGSVIPPVPWQSSSAVYRAKPVADLYRFARALDALEAGATIVIAGGGMSGVELACCIASRFAGRGGVTLVHGDTQLAPHVGSRARRVLTRVLEERGVTVVLDERVTGFDGASVATSADRKLPCAALVIATGLAVHPLIDSIGLPAGPHGLVVESTLSAADDPRVFAIGDCADIGGLELPEVGVYGVRAAPILAANLEALATRGSMRTYEPQQRYLSIMNLGAGDGLAMRGAFVWHGRLAWRLKDWIDRRFIKHLAVPQKN